MLFQYRLQLTANCELPTVDCELINPVRASYPNLCGGSVAVVV